MQSFRRLFFITLINLLPLVVSAEGHSPGVGLVLSGGGAKGIAHIGVIKALEENDIPIDYIVGTSMGSIVGSLYSIGYTPEDMMHLLASPYFGSMSTGTLDPSYTYYFARERATPQLFSIGLGHDGRHDRERYNPSSIIAPSPMTFGFMQIYTPASAAAGNDFDRLMVPFRSVASNITKRRAEVLSHGDLSDAVRASMSFPMIFQPLKINGDIMYDGGLYANFPVEVIDTVFNPEIILGVDVGQGKSETPPNTFMDQIDMLIQQPQSHELSAARGIKMRIDLDKFGLLDWAEAAVIYQRGYDFAMGMMDSIKSRVKERRPASEVEQRRLAFRSSLPPMRFEKVNVTGGSARQNAYIKHFFEPRHGCDTIGETSAIKAYYHALSNDKIETLSPQAVLSNDSLMLFTLNIDAYLKKRAGLGFGGYVTSSNNSFLYIRAGWSTLSFSSLGTDIEAWIGQSYMAGALSGSVNLPTRTPSALRLLAVASRRRYFEREKVFFKDDEPTFVTRHEYFGRFSWAVAAGRTGEVNVGIGAGKQYNTFYDNIRVQSYHSGRDRTSLVLGQVFGEYNSSNLDSPNFPTKGFMGYGRIMGVAGKVYYRHTMEDGADPVETSGRQTWAQVDLKVRRYIDLHKHWSLGLEAQGVASTRKLLGDYYSAVSSAPAFTPTPASHNVFDPGLRANSFIAAGVVPVYKFNSNISARVSAHAFVPYRALVETQNGGVRYGRRFGKIEFFGEADVVFNFHSASLSAYTNYSTSERHFNVGIAFGIYITAPSFL